MDQDTDRKLAEAADVLRDWIAGERLRLDKLESDPPLARIALYGAFLFGWLVIVYLAIVTLGA